MGVSRLRFTFHCRGHVVTFISYLSLFLGDRILLYSNSVRIWASALVKTSVLAALTKMGACPKLVGGLHPYCVGRSGLNFQVDAAGVYLPCPAAVSHSKFQEVRLRFSGNNYHDLRNSLKLEVTAI